MLVSRRITSNFETNQIRDMYKQMDVQRIIETRIPAEVFKERESIINQQSTL